MLKAIFNWFRQPDPKSLAPAVQPEAAPYKTEAPAHIVPVTEAALVVTTPAEVGKPAADRVEATAPSKPAPRPRAKPAAKKPAPAKPAASKPAAMKAPVKAAKPARAKKAN
jgi:hypothetical protein